MNTDLLWTDVQVYFNEIKELPCWKADKTSNSTLIFNFGKKISHKNPRKEIHESGEWVLLIEDSKWKLLQDKKVLVDWKSTAQQDIVLKIPELLLGRNLNEVIYDPKTVETNFVFGNLTLATGNFDKAETNEEVDLWTFYTPYKKCYRLTSNNKFFVCETD